MEKLEVSFLRRGGGGYGQKRNGNKALVYFCTQLVNQAQYVCTSYVRIMFIFTVPKNLHRVETYKTVEL